MFLYRKHIKKLLTIKYICYNLVIIQIKNNLNLYQILSTTDIFPISWGGLDKGGLDKGFYDKNKFNMEFWIGIWGLDVLKHKKARALWQMHFHKLIKLIAWTFQFLNIQIEVERLNLDV